MTKFVDQPNSIWPNTKFIWRCVIKFSSGLPFPTKISITTLVSLSWESKLNWFENLSIVVRLNINPSPQMNSAETSIFDQKMCFKIWIDKLSEERSIRNRLFLISTGFEDLNVIGNSSESLWPSPTSRQNLKTLTAQLHWRLPFFMKLFGTRRTFIAFPNDKVWLYSIESWW